MADFDICDNAAEKHLKQYAQMISGLITDSKRTVDFGDYAGQTFSEIYSVDYVYCRQLLRLKPKTITMLLFQGYIQKMNFIYKPDVRIICEQYSSLKSNLSGSSAIGGGGGGGHGGGGGGGGGEKMKAITNN
jgi:hypothetical protein